MKKNLRVLLVFLLLLALLVPLAACRSTVTEEHLRDVCRKKNYVCQNVSFSTVGVEERQVRFLFQIHGRRSADGAAYLIGFKTEAQAKAWVEALPDGFYAINGNVVSFSTTQDSPALQVIFW